MHIDISIKLTVFLLIIISLALYIMCLNRYRLIAALTFRVFSTTNRVQHVSRVILYFFIFVKVKLDELNAVQGV